MLSFGAWLGKWAAELCWPSRCVSCGIFAGAHLCDGCLRTGTGHKGPRCRICDDACVAPVCRRCCLHSPHCLRRARGVYRYEGAIKRAILAGKNNGHEAVWPIFARLIGADPEAWALGQKADVLVPIPLAPHRRMSRGYNPSALLAQALGKLWHKPVGYLLRHNGAQARTPLSRLGAAARQRAATGAFGPARPNAVVPGLRLLLVDDVITTGATLREAAQTLMLMGAQGVTAVALARQTLEHGKRVPTRL